MQVELLHTERKTLRQRCQPAQPAAAVLQSTRRRPCPVQQKLHLTTVAESDLDQVPEQPPVLQSRARSARIQLPPVLQSKALKSSTCSGKATVLHRALCSG